MLDLFDGKFLAPAPAFLSHKVSRGCLITLKNKPDYGACLGLGNTLEDEARYRESCLGETLPYSSGKLLVDKGNRLAVSEDPVQDGADVDFLVVERDPCKHLEKQDTHDREYDAYDERDYGERYLKKDHARMKESFYNLLHNIKTFNGDSGADGSDIVHAVVKAEVDNGSNNERNKSYYPYIPGSTAGCGFRGSVSNNAARMLSGASILLEAFVGYKRQEG